MRKKKVSIGITPALAAIAVSLLLTGAHVAAQTETVLYNFDNTYGDSPQAGVIFDKAGNLYGTAISGGTLPDAAGTVFELMHTSGGSFTPVALEDFGINAGRPYGGVIFDGAGNLYGATSYGGPAASGMVYELTPQAGGGWAETVLYSFTGGADGGGPIGSLVFDSAGNLYGATTTGGLGSGGVVYELMPQAGGGWTEKVLHNFSNSKDGAGLMSGVILDGSGNVYGTTFRGGIGHGSGIAYELSPQAGGEWKETILYSFGQGKYDGENPFASLVLDAAGNLYGTTNAGGQYVGNGTVFELSPHAGGGWTETILHSFALNGHDGIKPFGSLIFDSAGNLYGTTSQGGIYGSGASFIGGTVFKLTPESDGSWTEQVLHNFGNGTDGSYPMDGLIFDSSGNLYGTTYYGGTSGGYPGDGAVFEISR